MEPTTFDVTAVVTLLTVGMVAGISAIGAAKLVPAATAVGWKWLKAMVFG